MSRWNIGIIIAHCFVLLCCAGCAKDGYGLPNSVKLTGKLSDAGEPLFVEGLENATGMITVGFHRIEEGKPGPEVTNAMVDIEGNFEIPQGIEPGEYLITVRQWQPYPQNDLLKGKFSERKSPIRRTIDGDTVLEIDISNTEE